MVRSVASVRANNGFGILHVSIQGLAVLLTGRTISITTDAKLVGMLELALQLRIRGAERILDLIEDAGEALRGGAAPSTVGRVAFADPDPPPDPLPDPPPMPSPTTHRSRVPTPVALAPSGNPSLRRLDFSATAFFSNGNAESGEFSPGHSTQGSPPQVLVAPPPARNDSSSGGGRAPSRHRRHEPEGVGGL